MRILSIAETQALEAAANAAGHTYDQMMELAGQNVARAILERFPMRERRVLVLVGPGNNGGDGLVAARYLQNAGANVTAYLTRPRTAEKDPVFKQAVECGVTIITQAEDKTYRKLRNLVAQAHVLVDGLLGTGAHPPLRGTLAEILRATQAVLASGNRHPLTSLNRAPEVTWPHPLIVAVDGPSGMDFDTGETDPLTLPAHLTVTFATPKLGHFRFPGAELVGELVVADIGIPPEIVIQTLGRSRLRARTGAEKVGELVVADIGIPVGVKVHTKGAEVVTASLVQAWLPERPVSAHKGTFGKVIIVAGSVNYTGAAALAAIAAVRAGAGLVTLALAGSLHDAVVSLVPEATTLLLPHALGSLTADAVTILEDPMRDYQALLLGPGLGQAPETVAFVQAFFGQTAEKRNAGFLTPGNVITSKSHVYPPLVVDADGLNILSQLPDWPSLLPPGTILTPHPGEMARLTGKNIAELQANRQKTALTYATAWGHIVVLKGAFTVIAAPDGRAVLLPFANSGLASAGTGDVLAGTIVALRGQGLGAFEAAAAGAYLHGLAGELARQQFGAAGMAAGDVARALPEAFKRISDW